jgi:glycerophosphoryl diester phosphodiesterase
VLDIAQSLVSLRGNALDHPENSLPAIEAALALGVTHIEIDVQLSADGEPMVIHDDTLLRAAGVDMWVHNLPAAELAGIGLSDPPQRGGRFSGTRIPRLAEVLERIASRKDVTLFVDIKNSALSHFGHDQVVPAVLGCLHAQRRRCVVVAHDLPTIYRARQMSGVRIGWALDSFDSHTQLKYEALSPEFLFCHKDLVSGAGGLPRGPWHWIIHEIDTRAELEAWRTRGVKLFGTRAPGALLAELADA